MCVCVGGGGGGGGLYGHLIYLIKALDKHADLGQTSPSRVVQPGLIQCLLYCTSIIV